MKSQVRFCGCSCAALLSDALVISGGSPLSGSVSAHRQTRGHSRLFALAMALPALILAPFTAKQAWPQQGAYGAPYTNPYAGQYGGGQPNGYGQPQYSPPQYPPQSQYPPQYQQPQYASPEGYPQQDYTGADQQYPQQDYAEPQTGAEPNQALDASQLEQLLAPIALYPDALLAQVLTAATYPAQVAAADAWLNNLQAQGASSQDQIVAGADAHTEWDPSVKSMTAFPQVLDMMARNLEWTTNLGNAYYNQPDDVMQTAQVLRQRAEDAGNLQSTPQEPLTYDQGYIQLAPPNQQTVYVPSYDPWSVYGQQISPYPGFSLADAVGSFFGSDFGQGAINYGLGIALSAFGRAPWGFLGWGLNWLANAVLFNQSDYFTNSSSVADWGLPYGGPRAYHGRWDRTGLSGGYYRGGDRQWAGNSYGREDRRGYERSYGYNRGQSFAGRGREFYGHRGDEHFNPVYGGQRNPFGRSGLTGREAYSRGEPGFGRTQRYSGAPQLYRNQFGENQRTEYGYGFGNRPSRGISARPGIAYTNPREGFRAPQSSFGHGNGFLGRENRNNSGWQTQPKRSGGFHLFGFGHSHDSGGFNSGRASRNYFGGGRSSRSFGREKPPKMPKMQMPKQRSSWGGHSGGSHFSSHSSGGHSSHFSGGGHRSSGHHR